MTFYISEHWTNAHDCSDINTDVKKSHHACVMSSYTLKKSSSLNMVHAYTQFSFVSKRRHFTF